MADVVYPAHKNVMPERPHDYLYDTVYIVSGARDYTRKAFKAAMQSAQVTVQPVYKTMFADAKNRQRNRLVFHPNCRLPDHMDCSYAAYLNKRQMVFQAITPDPTGSRFQFNAAPRQVLATNTVEPDFKPDDELVPTILSPGRPVNRGTQSIYRESSAQTRPWQPQARAANSCTKKPEVLYLNQLQWGPGEPYRTADLPADFHTTEIINKMRHARVWMDLIDSGQIPRGVQKRDAIIREVELNDWIFREAEIDELQGIRLTLLNKVTNEERQSQADRNTRKLAELWHTKKKEMQRKIERIRRSRDRELRKLSLTHTSGGSAGLVARQRASRAGGPVTLAAFDPTSDVHAPVARHGYQARGRHAVIYYDPELITYEDHKSIGDPPPWVEKCTQDLKPANQRQKGPQLCERESKWSEQFLENLHNELKKARLGAAIVSAGPLHVLKPRRLRATPRPATPIVEAVGDGEEMNHQMALVLQKVIRGRAVQTLMYEGRTRAAELTAELKSTHGLQREDKTKIETDEAKARDYNAKQSEAEQKEDAIAALVDELCGGAVSAALDFLEKELRRLKYERRQHAFILIALREKTMREAAEAGRRQKEIHRRREHDEIFKQVLGLTQETVDAYLREIIEEGVVLAAENDAVNHAQQEADKVDAELRKQANVSTAEQNELVAELVQQFLLPEAHRSAARHRIAQLQRCRMEAARKSIFGLLNEAQVAPAKCSICGSLLDESRRCQKCPFTMEPVATTNRLDPRWKATRRVIRPEPKTTEQRYPPIHEIRCMLNALVDDVAAIAHERREDKMSVYQEMVGQLRSRTEARIDANAVVSRMIDDATGVETETPPVRPDYKHVMHRTIRDALERSQEPKLYRVPSQLPSELRRRAHAAAAARDPTCRCVRASQDCLINTMKEEEKQRLLPSELRILEEMRRCKCDASPRSDSTAHPVEHVGKSVTLMEDDAIAEQTESEGEEQSSEEGEEGTISPGENENED